MKPRIQLPRELRAGPFSTDMATQFGVSEKRLRGRDLDTPHRGVRVMAGTVSTQLDLARAVEPRLPVGFFFSHVTAAVMWQIPLPFGLTERMVVDVATGPDVYPIRGPSISGHRLHVHPEDVVRHDGRFVT